MIHLHWWQLVLLGLAAVVAGAACVYVFIYYDFVGRRRF